MASPPTQQWAATYNGPYSRPDAFGTAVAFDAPGNVYVTGYSYNSSAGNYDYATVKYDADGNEQWSAQYDGGGTNDGAFAIAVDASGNVCVTGISFDDEGYSDNATLKYDGASGNQLWVARYDGGWTGLTPGIAVDASGNAYVTGPRYDPEKGDYDYATVKFDAGDGHQVWATRYDGGVDDEPTAIAVDASGNVYVTGYSYDDLAGDHDYATVKYDAGDGHQVWATRYDNGNTDWAQAIALDASGNACVTGYSYNSAGNHDYATVKYDAGDGRQIWATRYDNGGVDEANAIAVDASGNACVTGRSYDYSTGGDYATVKYDAVDGRQIWATRYDGGSDEEAQAIRLDAWGNACVTGRSYDNSAGNNDYATVKYDAGDGHQLWATRYDGGSDDEAQAIAVDASGNACVTGSSRLWGSCFLTLKYDAGGVQQWRARYNGVGWPSDDGFVKVARDAAGNVYATGLSSDTTGNYDYATVKYDAGGRELWVARYDNGGNDEARGIAVDASGNAYVTGLSYDITSGNYDYATVKYDAGGHELWVARYDGGGYDVAQAIAIDPSGNVFVTGKSFSPDPASHHDYVTVKYDAAGGNPIWVARYDHGSVDEPCAIAVDASGNVCVTGRSFTDATNYDFATVKYDAAGGNPIWVARYNLGGFNYEEARAIAVDASGNVYVTGLSSSSSGNNYVTFKYDAANGNQLWMAWYDGGNGDDPCAIAVDASGNAYVTGYSFNSALNPDYATVKYNAGGTEQWVARYDAGGYDYAQAIALDASGNVYVTGYSMATSYDWATVKYDAGGTEQWLARYDGGDYEFANAVAVDASGNVFVAGMTITAAGDYDGLVIKYQGLARPDVGVASIVGPSGIVSPGTVTPQVVVHNYGDVRVGFDVTFKVNSTPPYEETVNIPGGVPPGEDLTVNFPRLGGN